MTDTTTTTNPYAAPLDDLQAARAAALTIAQTVLTGKGSPFGGTPNSRPYVELIEVAEYIVAGKPAPEVAEPVVDKEETMQDWMGRAAVFNISPAAKAAWQTSTTDYSDIIDKVNEAVRKLAANSVFAKCENPECPCNQEAPAEKAEPDATPAAADEPNPIHDNLADALAAAGERRRQKRAERAAVKAAR